MSIYSISVENLKKEELEEMYRSNLEILLSPLSPKSARQFAEDLNLRIANIYIRRFKKAIK